MFLIGCRQVEGGILDEVRVRIVIEVVLLQGIDDIEELFFGFDLLYAVRDLLVSL
jgi:hypothetical protein